MLVAVVGLLEIRILVEPNADFQEVFRRHAWAEVGEQDEEGSFLFLTI